MNKDFVPSILNDVIGPVMRGPSSSHTAASWRIAKTALQLLDDELEYALIELVKKSIWASNYREQGTALGMDGGLLGIDMADPRLICSGQIAKEKGVTIEYKISQFETHHPNTVLLTLKGKKGRTAEVTAISTGGGMFELTRFNGHKIDIKGDSHCILVITAYILKDKDIESIKERMTLSNKISQIKEEESGLLQFNAPFPFSKHIKNELLALQKDAEILIVDPVLPILSGNESAIPFTDPGSLLDLAAANNASLGQLGLLYECRKSGLNEQTVMEKMERIVHIIEGGIDKGLDGTEYEDRILHQQSHLISASVQSGNIKTGSLINNMVAYITALMEAKSAMEVIVAVPTAGSCGTFGGAIRAFCEENNLSEEQKIMAYFAGGIIGIFIAMGPGFSAEEHGCQVETGAAGCMAAAALTDLSGGDAHQSLSAASLAMQNSIGLICDPVADRVEVPCLGKNVSAGMNALAASTMALAGYDPVIPLEEVLQTVKKVGRSMPAAHCNTGLGGLASTKSAQKLKALLNQQQSRSIE